MDQTLDAWLGRRPASLTKEKRVSPTRTRPTLPYAAQNRAATKNHPVAKASTSSSPSDDDFELQRFVDAQNNRGAYANAIAELKAGRKQSHWIWFVFPQIEGLGKSFMSQHYSISGMEEARAYVAHPVLGARLVEAARAVLEGPAPTAADLMKSMPDDALKLRSSMTLFARVSSDKVFQGVLKRYFDGGEDEATVKILEQE
ncbi:hypothetical protein NKR23_g4323 [Pleurostoma richardsiae]|uniref:Calpastatin n=1 Tax=Pleurostoma richardsiae TaxID=41990 RepID=A0AA38VFW1_9PEZI|nr:hypothetical protein NKR23_g4323 [Pleurostoma richardsiae]